MNGLLALSLTLALGQTPTNEAQAPGFTLGPEPAQSQAQTREPSEEERRAAQELEMRQLQLELETLRTEVEAQQQQDQERIQGLQQRQAVEQDRARALEQLRQQHLASLQRAYDWLITADQLLESGELDVTDAVESAQREISAARSTATAAGRGQTVQFLERAQQRLSTIYTAVDQRDVFPARWQLQAAGYELRAAWLITLNRPSATLVNQ